MPFEFICSQAKVGNRFIAGARWLKPLEGEQKYFHSIVFAMAYKDFDELVGLIDAESIVTAVFTPCSRWLQRHSTFPVWRKHIHC